jgi:hypothetical protein
VSTEKEVAERRRNEVRYKWMRREMKQRTAKRRYEEKTDRRKKGTKVAAM